MTTTQTATAPRRFKSEDEMTSRERRIFWASINDPRKLPDLTTLETDEWREWADLQRAELAERRDELQRQVADAQHALGVAIIDRESGAPARKRLEALRGDLEGLAEAERTMKRRWAEEAQAQAEASVRASRARAYQWMRRYFEAAEGVLEARAALAAAEAAVRAVGPPTGRAQFARRYLLGGESDLDRELVGVSGSAPNVSDRLELQRCRELREKAERLAALEEV
jgi:hypothetical protein